MTNDVCDVIGWASPDLGDPFYTCACGYKTTEHDLMVIHIWRAAGNAPRSPVSFVIPLAMALLFLITVAVWAILLRSLIF